MGVSISSKNYNFDLGYNGFKLFREKVAELTSKRFKEHYKKLSRTMLMNEEESELFFEEFNNKTVEFIEKGEIEIEIVDFLVKSDLGATIDSNQATKIYEKIKDYDDQIAYGYIGQSDCTRFSDLKRLFKDCADEGGEIEWY